MYSSNISYPQKYPHCSINANVIQTRHSNFCPVLKIILISAQKSGSSTLTFDRANEREPAVRNELSREIHCIYPACTHPLHPYKSCLKIRTL